MDFITAGEYSKKYGIDRATINRLINAGRIPAQKLGSQWVIPADTPAPEDRRVKSGQYKNWRRKKEPEA